MTITTQAVREMAEMLRGHVNARGGSSLENGFWQRAINASDMLVALVEERDRLAAAVEELTTENKAVSEQAYSFATENEALTARAEAAEAALRETRAALEPFADVLSLDEGDEPEDREPVQVSCGGTLRLELTAADFRLARATLQGRDGDG